MGLLTFKGGVHPNDGKSLAKDKAIVELLPQGDLVYPLSQHIGAPAKPVVAKGDHVLKGQKIAEAGGFVSAPIYASVSGTVKAIEPRVNPTGSKVNSIIIANDGQYEEVEYPQPKPLSELTKEEILNIIGEAGSFHQKSQTRLIISLQTVRNVSRILLPITEECWRIRNFW